MAEFTSSTCGVVDPANRCRCAVQAARLVRVGALDRERLCWTALPADGGQVDELEGIERALAIFRSHPDYRAPSALADGLRQVIQRSAFAAATGAKSNPRGK